MKSRNPKSSIALGLIVIFLSACNSQMPIEPSATIFFTSAISPTTSQTRTLTSTATVTPHATITPTAMISPQPGTLVFSSCSTFCDIFIINNDGSGLTKLTTSEMFYIFYLQWSPDGTKIVFSALEKTSDCIGDSPNPNNQSNGCNFDIFTISADGSQLKNLTNNQGEDSNPDWSPDGKKIVFNSDRSGNHEIYSINADGTGLKRLTNNSLVAIDPQWSPDGSWIAYTTAKRKSTGDPYFEICIMNPDGTMIKEITEGDSPHWSPDGSNIAFTGYTGSIIDIFMIKPDGTGLMNFTNSNGFEFGLSWSPDSSHIAYVSGREDNTEIYTICVDCDNNPPINITNSEVMEQEPFWSPDGTQIAFQSGDILCIINADGSQKKCFNKQSKGSIDWKP